MFIYQFKDRPPYLLWKRRQRWARPSGGRDPRTSPGTRSLLSQALLSCPACLMDRRPASSLCHGGLSQTPSGYPGVKTSVRAKTSSEKKLLYVLHLLTWETICIHNDKSQLLGGLNSSLLYVFTGQVWIFTDFRISEVQKYALPKKYKLPHFKIYLSVFM